ncbi:MAG: hypothetical protein HY208_02595 [Nitrospirae bacterium]|nr:hypothetical protein [Nitrospirota bacterium]
MGDRVAAVLFAVAGLGVCGVASDAGAATQSVHVEAGVDEKFDDLALYVVTPSGVSERGDWITEPYLTLSYTTSRRLPTKLVFDVTADIYARYSVLDYQTYRFLIRQAIDEKTAVTLKYTFIPKIFFGDDMVGVAPGVPFKDQQHEIHLVQLTADRDLRPELNVGLSARYGIRDAEPAFNYRDSSLWGVSVDGLYRPAPRWRLTTGAAFEQDMARGGTNKFTTAPDDASYNQVSAYAGLTYSIRDRWLLKGRYAFRWRDYTTSLVPSVSPPPQTGDPLHYGRTDFTNSLLFVATYRLAAPLFAKAGYESIWRDSTKSYARYHENIYTVGLNYRF